MGDLSNCKNLLDEPADHAIGTSRGGLTTKIHALVDANKRPLVLLPGPLPGQARTSPARAMADKAYSSKRIRSRLRAHGIQCVIRRRKNRRPTAKATAHSAGGRSMNPAPRSKDM